jgi:hypothetical protein
MPASLSAAPTRSQAISSSDLLLIRSRVYSPSRLTTWNFASSAFHLGPNSGPITPTRLPPRRPSSSITVAMPLSSPQRTSTSRAVSRACGTWL